MKRTSLNSLRHSSTAAAESRTTLATIANKRLLALFLMLFAFMLPSMPASAGATEKPAKVEQVMRVNVNKADAATLERVLKGIGSKRAEEIVRYREQYGEFKSVEQLSEVKGIGPSILDKNRDRIEL